MAIKIKPLFADALLSLVNEKKIYKITIADLLDKTGASRQTFYNHFKDKNDLIQWIYSNYILLNFQNTSLDIKYNEYHLDYLKRIVKYRTFMRQAISYSEQNCLREYMHKCLIGWDREWFEKIYTTKYHTSPPAEFFFFVEYHSWGSVSMILKWIDDDFPIAPEVFHEYCMTLRSNILEYWNIYDIVPRWDTHFYSNINADSDYPLI